MALPFWLFPNSSATTDLPSFKPCCGLTIQLSVLKSFLSLTNFYILRYSAQMCLWASLPWPPFCPLLSPPATHTPLQSSCLPSSFPRGVQVRVDTPAHLFASPSRTQCPGDTRCMNGWMSESVNTQTGSGRVICRDVGRPRGYHTE